jgi:hypothetical protein
MERAHVGSFRFLVWHAADIRRGCSNTLSCISKINVSFSCTLVVARPLSQLLDFHHHPTLVLAGQQLVKGLREVAERDRLGDDLIQVSGTKVRGKP